MSMTEAMAWKNRARFAERFGVEVDIQDFIQLRRDSMRLHRWFERLCLNIEVDDDTEDAYEYNPNTGGTRWRVPNPEPGARKRIKEICEKYELYFYVQSDPRGATLYLSDSPIDDCRYNDAYCVIE